jgi:phage-related protein
LLAIITGPIGIAVYEIVTHWTAIKNFTMRIVGDVLNWVKQHWKFILAWLVAPIGMAVFEIRSHWKLIVASVKAMVHDVAAGFAGVRHAAASLAHDVVHWFDMMRHDAAAIADAIPHLIAHGFDVLRHAASTTAANTRHMVASTWDRMRHDAAALIDGVVGFFTRLPGRIYGVLRSLPGQMLRIGKNVIDGLINGIKDAARDIPGIMKSLASDVASYFTDPLKIFSPSRLFHQFGVYIVKGLSNGITLSKSLASNAIGKVADAVTTGFSPRVAKVNGPGRGGSGNTYNFTIKVDGVVGDPGATGRKIVQTINDYFRQTGQPQLASA